MSEIDLMRHLMKQATRLGARLFRQNTGMGWIGKAIRIERTQTISVGPGDVVIRKARPFHTGFDGWSDLGGWSPLVVTADMIGATIAVYTQAEIKENARPTQEQLDWIAAVNRAGGRAGIARNEADLAAIINRTPSATG